MDACFAYEEELQKKTTYNDPSVIEDGMDSRPS
jgi:hypothetical protein